MYRTNEPSLPARLLPGAPGVGLLFCFLALAAPGLSQSSGDPAAAAYRAAYKQVLDESWTHAVTAFDELLARHSDSRWADDAHFWRCYSLQQVGSSNAESFECFEALTRERPDSEWVDDARRHLVSLAQQLRREGHPEYHERVRGFGQTEDHEQLLAVLVALGDIGDERSLEVVLGRLRGTDDERLRARIVEVLGHFESPKATAALTEIIRQDPSLEVRARAIEAFEDEGPEIRALLRELAQDEEQPETLRTAAVARLADTESPDLVPFFVSLAMSGSSPEITATAVFALGEIRDDRAFEALRRLYEKASDPHTRHAVLAAVTEREDPRALELLRQAALDDSDPELALQAVSMLGEFETPRALEYLRQFATDSKNWRARLVALHAMGEHETPAAAEALATFARNTQLETRLRLAAIEALAETENDAAVPVLFDLAKGDPRPEVRRLAAEALGEHGTAAARDALIRLLETNSGS